MHQRSLLNVAMKKFKIQVQNVPSANIIGDNKN